MLFINRKNIIQNGYNDELKKLREDTLEILKSSIKSVDPYNSVKSKFKENKIIFNSKTFNISDYKNVYLIGFGKASIGMTQAVCDSIEVKKGIVITNDPLQKIKNSKIKTYLGSHPIPNQNNIDGTDKALDIIKNCKKNDLLIVLISGGGSALFCKPLVDLGDLQKSTDLLLKSGANINEINTIRKHLSHVKGGKIASYTNCTVISFIISDIIGDPIEFIASGPTYPDTTTFTDAKKILKKYNIEMKIPSDVKKKINEGIRGVITETPKEGDPIFNKVSNFIIANNKIACNAAQKKAEELGYRSIIITTSLDGEAKYIGKYLIDKVINFLNNGKRFVFIAGGESTVKIKGSGKGGRNQEMVLSCVKQLSDTNVVFSSFASDGIDGISNAAGAIADGYSYKRALKKELNPDDFLKQNNSYEFFKNLNDLLMTGSTGTNVMDIQIIIKI